MTQQDRPSRLRAWTARWQAALDAATTHGRTDKTTWGAGRVAVGPPASADDLELVARALPVPIPPGLREVLSIARWVDASWHFEDRVEAPRPFHLIFAGECAWDLDGLVGLSGRYQEWVEGVFPDPDDSYDRVWHDKFPFLDVRNGDLVAVDEAGRVVYLSHRDGAGHGYVLGVSVEDFLDRWTALGCPGPEDWQWLPFSRGPESLLDPAGGAAREWRRWFGMPDLP